MAASEQGGNAAADITLSTKNGGVQGTGVCQSATIAANVGNMAVQDNSTWSIGDITKT